MGPGWRLRAPAVLPGGSPGLCLPHGRKRRFLVDQGEECGTVRASLSDAVTLPDAALISRDVQRQLPGLDHVDPEGGLPGMLPGPSAQEHVRDFLLADSIESLSHINLDKQ